MNKYVFKIVIEPKEQKTYQEIKKIMKEYKAYFNDLGALMGVEFFQYKNQEITSNIWLLNPDERFKEMKNVFQAGSLVNIIISNEEKNNEESIINTIKKKKINNTKELIDCINEQERNKILTY